MKTYIKSILLLLSVIASLHVAAQKNFLKDAHKAFASKEFYTAQELYKKAYTRARTKEEKAIILFKTAECYRLMGNAKQSETWYAKADKVKYPDPETILYLADARKAQGKYDEAIVDYKRYKIQVPADLRGENGARSCELAQKWKDNPSRYVVENMAMLNSKEADFAPTYASKKYTALYFTTTRDGLTGGQRDPGPGQNFSDLVETKRDNKSGRWSTPVPLTDPLNTKDNEGASFVSRKGKNVYYTRCTTTKNQEAKCQLYMAIKRGNAWSDEIKLPFCTDSFAFGHPTLNDKEDMMIFSSDMPGGYGGKDLWCSLYDKKTKAFGSPINLGPEINTRGEEMYPFLHPDGTLYFSSTDLLGMGGLDIFKATNSGNNKWKDAENLKAPINSAADDFAIIFEGTRERGYFSSNREGGKGGDDIYSFALPQIMFKDSGGVTDCINGIPLEGVTIRLVGSDGTNVETKTDKNGKYCFSGAGGEARYINVNTSYIISTDATTTKATIYAEKYLNNLEKGKITTVGETQSKIFIQNFCLIPSITEIILPAVLYDYNSASLRAESKDSLEFLYEILIDNPTMIIELASHTDCRGSSEYNLRLSQARAQSCVDYLIKEKGIPTERLVAKGYGEDRPLKIGKNIYLTEKYINSLKTEEEKEAAHQRNRRTVFRVLSWDYVDVNASKPAPIVKPKVRGEEEGYEEEDTEL